eukprot:366010-Chlamydomonas_euryale.AAC.9
MSSRSWAVAGAVALCGLAAAVIEAPHCSHYRPDLGVALRPADPALGTAFQQRPRLGTPDPHCRFDMPIRYIYEVGTLPTDLVGSAGVDVRGALAPGDVQQMIMDARFASLEALEDEARRCGRETLGPSAWGISLPSFDAALLAAERARLLGLRIHALTIVRNGPTVTASNP